MRPPWPLPALLLLLLPLLASPGARGLQRHSAGTTFLRPASPLPRPYLHGARNPGSDGSADPAAAPVAYLEPAAGAHARLPYGLGVDYMEASPLSRRVALEPPCSEPPPPPDGRAARSRLRPYPSSLLPVRPVQPPPTRPTAADGFPEASPRSDSEADDDTEMRLAVPGTRRGYYGHEVGYGSYFPIGLDPLTILAGLAFLAFIIQTLYLLLYKHYGLGLGASAGVGIGPLSADRHQRDEQQAWANSVASRIDATASTYESGAANGTDGVSPPVVSAGQDGPSGQQAPPDGEVDAAEAEGRDDRGQTRGRRRQMGSPPSPLDTFLSALRRSWSAHTPARDCSPAWLCRLVHWARVLTEPLAALSTYRPRPPPQLQPLSRAAPAPRTPMMATHASSPEPDTGPT